MTIEMHMAEIRARVFRIGHFKLLTYVLSVIALLLWQELPQKLLTVESR
jgi:hypothetical protein